jgi:hypothetical protein
MRQTESVTTLFSLLVSGGPKVDVPCLKLFPEGDGSKDRMPGDGAERESDAA